MRHRKRYKNIGTGVELLCGNKVIAFKEIMRKVELESAVLVDEGGNPMYNPDGSLKKFGDLK